MDAVGVGLGLGTLIMGFIVIWRVFVIEEALHSRVDDIDSSLGAVVGAIIEKIDAISSQVPDINLINQNPIGQIIDFLKGNAPPDSIINRQEVPRTETGQFVEVESEISGKTESKEENKSA